MSKHSLIFLLLASVAASGVGAAPSLGEVYDVSLRDFPRLADETDDTSRLQRAVDATGDGGVLFLPKGEYSVSRPIVVTNGTSLLLHKSATVRAVAKMACLFDINMMHTGARAWGGSSHYEGHPHDQGMFFAGGHLDGNGLATCLSVNCYFHYTMRDTVFVNGYPYGLHVGKSGAEIIAENLYFRTIKRGLAGNIALYSEGNDSYYSRIVVVDYTTGLKTTGTANAFDHYHVWGGPIPPKGPGRPPEMLENSVCFNLGGSMNLLRDCYADTATVGFKVSGWGHQIVGSWFLNNPDFGLKEITVVEQAADSSDLLIADCCFRGAGDRTKLYVGSGAVKWRDMVYSGFPEGAELPAEIVTGRICDCPTADEWNYADGVQRFSSAPGEFCRPNTARSLEIPLIYKPIRKRFPKAGAGTAFVIRIRATDEATKRVEFSFSQQGGRIWGKVIDLSPEWREVTIPFEDLRYFTHWGCPALKPGEKPDVRLMSVARFMFGNFLTNGSADRAHGFEVESLKVIGRE